MHIFLIATISVDGFIAKNDDEPSTSWSSKEDTQWFKSRTLESGVVVMGRTSYETIPDKYRPLKDRLNIVYTSTARDGLEKISVDLWKTSLSPAGLVQQLESDGHTELAIAGGKRVYTDWIKSGLIDTLYLTVEPVIFGNGTKLFDSEVIHGLQLTQVHKLSSQTQVLEYSLEDTALS